MRFKLAILFFLFVGEFFYAQENQPLIEIDSIKQNNPKIVDAQENDSMGIYQPTAFDYKFFRLDQDTLYFDQELSIKNYYKKNFTQKDYFGKMQPGNLGKPFNDLVFQLPNAPISRFLPTGKLNNFITESDIRYFDVKTPTTEFDYESGVKEGQSLSTLFTHSPNSKINYFIHYKGLRSQGKYQNEFAINNSVALGLNYHTKNKKYRFLTHYIIQNIDNNENGGITNRSDFENKSTTFSTRIHIPVNLQGVNSAYNSRRFQLVQYFRLFGKVDSTQRHHLLDIKSNFIYEKNTYYYTENQANTFFSNSLVTGAIRRSENLQSNIENKIGLEYRYKSSFSAEIGHLFNDVQYSVLQTRLDLPSTLTESMQGIYANLKTQPNHYFSIKSLAQYSLSSTYENPYQFQVEAIFSPIKGYSLFGNFTQLSALPKFNYQLNQSFYNDYNYYNPNLKNENTQKIDLGIDFTPLKTKITSSLTSLDNLLYLDQNYLAQQLNSNIQILSAEIENTLTYKRMNWTNQARYQQLNENQTILPLPNWIVRSSLYYQGPAFKGKTELQTGVNVYYFSAFQSREISPIHNEYKLQSTATSYSIGEIPNMDIFFNLKVKRMRIYLKLENISSTFTENYYTLPYIPYTDWRFRFGIKWYLFT